jgi:hypothetical protein
MPVDAIGDAKIIPNSQLTNVSMKLNYVVLEDGSVVVGKSGHSALANGQSVQAAGEVRLVNGEIRTIDNASGHYQPTATVGPIAERAFESIGMNAAGKFQPKIWVSDSKLPNGGLWKPIK